jgi:DNA modification methylase
MSQKPEALLERLVGALSDRDELVLDPCAGSGTTLVVAARMGRRFIGIDSSPSSDRDDEGAARADGAEGVAGGVELMLCGA